MPRHTHHRRRTALVPALIVAATLALAHAPCAVRAQVTDDDFRDGLVTQRDRTGDAASRQPGWLMVLKMFASLAFVLGLIALIAWLYRRYGPTGALRAGGGGRHDAIRVVATRMLGGRRSLMLVRVRGQTLLLGVTAQSIQCLTEIHEVEGEWARPADDDDAPSAPGGPFGRQLGRFVDQTLADEDLPTPSPPSSPKSPRRGG